MTAADTSVAIAAVLRSTASHELAIAAFPRRKPALAAHVAIETYSALTRLPPPVLGAGAYESVLGLAAREGIVGGAVYDAAVYRAVGVDYRLIA